MSETTSSVSLPIEKVHNYDDTLRGGTAGGQSTAPMVKDEAEPEPESRNPDDEPPQYITGIKLHLVLFGITAVMFLVMLDMTIVVTVSSPHLKDLWEVFI